MGSYLLGGANGVGKSRIFNELQKTKLQLECVHTATALMDQLSIEPGDYDTLRSLPDDVKNYATGEVIRQTIAHTAMERTIVFDFHYLNLIDGETRPTISAGDTWPTLLSGVALVDSGHDVIYERIKRDERNRRLFPKDAQLTEAEERKTITTFVEATRQEFGMLAARFALPSVVICNDDEPALAAAAFVDFHEAVMGVQSAHSLADAYSECIGEQVPPHYPTDQA